VIVNIIKDRDPDQYKLPFALWTREAVRDLIWGCSENFVGRAL